MTMTMNNNGDKEINKILFFFFFCTSCHDTDNKLPTAEQLVSVAGLVVSQCSGAEALEVQCSEHDPCH